MLLFNSIHLLKFFLSSTFLCFQVKFFIHASGLSMFSFH